MGVKLYTRRDLAKLLSIGIAGTALESQCAITRSSLALRGAMMSGCKDTVPYPLVEYVYVTDLGYFDTPILDKSSVYGEFDVKRNMGAGQPSFAGRWQTGVGIVGYTGGKFYVFYNTTPASFGNVLNRTKFTFENGRVVCNGEEFTFTPVAPFSFNRTIHIGQLANNTIIKVASYFYSVKLSDGENSIDCVPVLLPDGSGGLWDKVSKSLLQKSETGTFTAGPII